MKKMCQEKRWSSQIDSTDPNRQVFVLLWEKERCWWLFLHNSTVTLRDWLSGRRQTDAHGCTTHPPCFKEGAGWFGSTCGSHLFWIMAALCAVERGEWCGIDFQSGTLTFWSSARRATSLAAEPPACNRSSAWWRVFMGWGCANLKTLYQENRSVNQALNHTGKKKLLA